MQNSFFAQFMAVSSECYLQKIECKVIIEALTCKIAPKAFERFVKNRHINFVERCHENKFLEIIKCTFEIEDHKHSLNFVDINITNNNTNKKNTNSKYIERT